MYKAHLFFTRDEVKLSQVKSASASRDPETSKTAVRSYIPCAYNFFLYSGLLIQLAIYMYMYTCTLTFQYTCSYMYSHFSNVYYSETTLVTSRVSVSDVHS